MSEESTELYYAHMEADRNEAEDEFFSARPSLGTDVDKALFRAGFERSYTKLWHRVRQLERENAELRRGCGTVGSHRGSVSAFDPVR